MSVLQDFIEGFTVAYKGFRYIRQNASLWKYVLIPFVIYGCLFSAGLKYGNALILHFKTWFFAQLPDWLNTSIIIQTLFNIFGWLLLIVTVFYIVFVLAGIIAAPFNAFLAEKVLISYCGKIPQPESYWVGLWRMLLVSFKKMIFFAGLSLALMILALVPGVNVAVIFCALFILAFDCSDFSFEALFWDWGKRRNFVRTNLAIFIGLSIFLGGVLLIPGINVFVMPFTIAGSALMVAKRTSERG